MASQTEDDAVLVLRFACSKAPKDGILALEAFAEERLGSRGCAG